MITRRELLANASIAMGAVLVTAALPGCDPQPAPAAKLLGINDGPATSQTFTGMGWYAFGYREPGFYRRIYYAEPDRGGFLPGFIDLSDGPGLPVLISISARGFDDCCIGKCLTQAEAEGRAAS